MAWLDSHAGSIQAIATLVLVAVTGYYAWASRALVHETRTTLTSSARATLQARMDNLGEIMIRHPDLNRSLDDVPEPGDAEDARFFIANILLAVLEEAHTQYAIERSMPADDWSAWAATADLFLARRYIGSHWQRVHHTFEPSFRRFVDARLQSMGPTTV